MQDVIRTYSGRGWSYLRLPYPCPCPFPRLRRGKHSEQKLAEAQFVLLTCEITVFSNHWIQIQSFLTGKVTIWKTSTPPMSKTNGHGVLLVTNLLLYRERVS